MLKSSKKSTFCRVGALCLIAVGITVVSCQQAPVSPQAAVNKGYPAPTSSPTDSLRVSDDQPPKDVSGGGGGGK